MTDETQVNVPVAEAPVAEAPAPEAPVAEAAEAEVPATAPAASVPPKGRRALGGAGQVVGIIGLVLSLVIAFGALAGSMWLTGQIQDVAVAVDTRIAEAQPKLDTLTTKVAEIKSGVDEVVAAADAVAQAATPSDGLIASLRDKVDVLEARYAGLRNAYGDLREKVSGAVASLQVLDRIIPGFDIPQGPIDALQAMDARIQELDGAVSGVLSTAFDGSVVRDAAAAVSQKVGRLASGLDAILGVITDAGGKLGQARADIAAAVAQLETVVTVGGIVIALLFVYVALLHWVLFRASRAVSRGA